MPASAPEGYAIVGSVVASEFFGCAKNTIRLRSGLYFDLVDPKPDQFTLRDIAGALAKTCRFGGHTPRFYSVAEHSALCASQAMRDSLTVGEIAAIFLHDATEAFCGDVVKPLKVMLPEYAAIEARIEKVIGQKFAVDFDRHADAIRKIDWEMLIAEKRVFFPGDSVEWAGQNQVRTIHPNIEMLSWPVAEAAFMAMAETIGLTTGD